MYPTAPEPESVPVLPRFECCTTIKGVSCILLDDCMDHLI